MTGPVSTDPAVAAGLLAALGAIGLAIRTRKLADRPTPTEVARATWRTRVARSVVERAMLTASDPEDEPVFDLRPAHRRHDINLRDIDLRDIDLRGGRGEKVLSGEDVRGDEPEDPIADS